MDFNDRKLNLQRYPISSNRTLKPWSAADELLLKTASEQDLTGKKIALINDSFGALATKLYNYHPLSIISHTSQLKATKINLKNNELDVAELLWANPLKLPSSTLDLVLIKIPKSADLFELYLSQLHSRINDNSVILCGFMTRNFTKLWLELAAQFFDVVEQTKAVKKSRLLILKGRKEDVSPSSLFHSVKNDLDLNLKQYSGVFSSAKVDIATTILLEHLPEVKSSDTVLDLGCGNGVVASFIKKQYPESNVHLLDDSFLAISSAKLNISKANSTFHWANSIAACKDQKFDLIVCNPPFHFEYETTIEIAITLFAESAEYLNDGGEFIIVANTHLNYSTHLTKLFRSVKQLVQSGKFEVLSCTQ